MCTAILLQFTSLMQKLHFINLPIVLNDISKLKKKTNYHHKKIIHFIGM